MVAELKNLNLYQQFMQQTDRNTQSNPVKPVPAQDSFEKRSVVPFDNKVYTDTSFKQKLDIKCFYNNRGSYPFILTWLWKDGNGCRT